MILNLKTIVTVLAILLLFSGGSLNGANRVKHKRVKSAKKDTLKTVVQPEQVKPKLKRTTTGDESIYFIDIKEERSYDNFFTRHFLTGYKDKDLRRILLDYGEKNFAPPFRSTYSLIIEKSFRFPIVIFFLAMISGLIINVILVIIVLFITNLYMNQLTLRRKNTRDQYEKILTDLMLQVIDTKQAILKLNDRKLKLRRNNNLLIEVLMDFQRSFRGDSDRQLTELYEEMDLGRVSYNKTYAVSFNQQVIGLRELANMQPAQVVPMISERLNDPHEIVRAEAQICYAYVNKESPFEFLSILEKPFSRWAQLNICYFIRIHEIPVPSFAKWLRSDHPNVVNFCTRMIALYQQHENSEEIIHLLDHPDESIRYEAIKACGELVIIESKQVLKNSFQRETFKNQLEIAKIFKNIGEESVLPFLENIVRSEVTALRLEACRSVCNINESSRNWLDSLNLTMKSALSPYIVHIQDPRN